MEDDWLEKMVEVVPSTSKKKRKQHFLARMHLKGFSDGTGHVWVYERCNPVPLQKGIMKVATKDFFYGLDVGEGMIDIRYENALSQLIEDPAARFIKYSVGKHRITSEFKRSFSYFVATAIVRTPDFRARMMRASEELKEVAREKKIDKFVAFLDANAPNLILNMMFPMIADLANILESRTWTILVTTPDKPFFTSDSAIAFQFPHGRKRVDGKPVYFGFKDDGTRIFFPITMQYMLIISSKCGYEEGYFKPNNLNYQEANALMFGYAKQQVYASHGNLKIPSDFKVLRIQKRPTYEEIHINSFPNGLPRSAYLPS